MSDYVPGWAFDPTLPTLPEEEPRCDICGRRLTDIAAGGLLPLTHQIDPRRWAWGNPCSRSRDDLLTIVYRLQRDAAGLEPPANPYGFWWVGRKLVATSTHPHRSTA